MIHDPMCHFYGESGESGFRRPCPRCRFIVEVRADERQRIIGVMERNADGDAMKVIDAVLDMTNIVQGES